MSEKKIKLNKKIIIKGTITAESGLLIGGSNTAMGIGGPDKMVIRNPISNEPYIPGSSLKGKMRSLLEVSYGYVIEEPMSKTVRFISSRDPNHVTALLFGTAISSERNGEGPQNQRPSRIIFRDGKLINGESFRDKTDLPYTESKTEVVIDRITSAAMPRTFERVPAGAEFDLEIVLNIFDTDIHNEDELVKHTIQGLQMLQDDYLGGSGSRGSGKIKFKIIEIKERSSDFYHGKEDSDKVYKYTIPQDLT